MSYTTKKTSIPLYKKLLSFMIVSCLLIHGFAQQTALKEVSMVDKFYILHQEPLYWFSSGKNMKRATEWLNAMEAADHLDFVSDKRQTDEMRAVLSGKKTINNRLKEKTDQQITRLVLDFLKYLQEGNIQFDYDEVNIQRDSVYIDQLLNATSKESVSKIVSRLDCKDPDYLVLKTYLQDSIPGKDELKHKIVLLAMNYRRYFSINHPSEYILVNIPAAEAEYYRKDVPLIKMRIVAGRKKTATPVIASYITSIVTFPYWNVPHSIAVKELLPKVQKNENYLEQNNFEVVDAKGIVVEDSELNWKNYNEKNFPYFFRQSTGAGNSLGVLKFNMQNPFSIFLHATSWQGVFAKDVRFLSHGCIRLEKPFELADALLRGKIDIEELKTGKKNTQSNTIELPRKIPTFILYMPVTIVDTRVAFLPDVYGLIK